VTSAFYGKGKKSAWEAWKSYPEVTQAFKYMESVNEAQRELFCQKNKTMDHIPPTQDSLLQHVKRVAYQSGIWATSELAQQPIPSPEGCGWTLDRDSQIWLPVWSLLPMASKACSELVKCGCKSTSGCGTKCSCKKAQWKCTELCSCKCDK